MKRPRATYGGPRDWYHFSHYMLLRCRFFSVYVIALSSVPMCLLSTMTSTSVTRVRQRSFIVCCRIVLPNRLATLIIVMENSWKIVPVALVLILYFHVFLGKYRYLSICDPRYLYVIIHVVNVELFSLLKPVYLVLRQNAQVFREREKKGFISVADHMWK